MDFQISVRPRQLLKAPRYIIVIISRERINHNMGGGG